MNNNTKNGVKKSLIYIFTALISAALIWIGDGLENAKSDVKVLNTEIKTLQRRIDEKTVNRYKGSDARDDFARVNERLKDMELRLRSLEKKK